MHELLNVFDTIHNNILEQLFQIDINTAPDSIDINGSFDSYESNKKQNKFSWIVERIID